MEVLLVIVLLVAVFFPLIQMLSRGLVASGEASGTNVALKLAQTRLEQIKNTVYSSIASESKATVPASPAFKRQVVVSEPSTNLKAVRVVVFWFTSDGSEVSVEVQSLIANF